jgi:hypothetical protein
VVMWCEVSQRILTTTKMEIHNVRIGAKLRVGTCGGCKKSWTEPTQTYPS